MAVTVFVLLILSCRLTRKLKTKLWCIGLACGGDTKSCARGGRRCEVRGSEPRTGGEATAFPRNGKKVTDMFRQYRAERFSFGGGAVVVCAVAASVAVVLAWAASKGGDVREEDGEAGGGGERV